jgi:hypothetical protein
LPLTHNINDRAEAFVTVEDSCDEPADRFPDRKFVPACADEAGGQLIVPHAFDRNRDVGHQEAQVVHRKSARRSHAGKQQVCNLDLSGLAKPLQVDREELTEVRADHSQVKCARQPRIKEPVESLGRSGKRKPLITGTDGDWRSDFGEAPANEGYLNEDVRRRRRAAHSLHH